MQCKEIIQVIEATFPRTAALGFDNVGLLAGRSEERCPEFIWHWMQQML